MSPRVSLSRSPPAPLDNLDNLDNLDDQDPHGHP